MPKILVINPGSASTKLAVFCDGALTQKVVLDHADAQLALTRHDPILAQINFRVAAIAAWLAEIGESETRWDAVAARGGLLKPLSSGTYEVNDEMLHDLREAARGEHASNLGAFLAHAIAKRVGCVAVIVDPVSVDELPEVARFSGLAGLDRVSLSHALNSKAVAKRYAAEIERAYADLRLLVVHLGSGISVSAHAEGRMIDVNNSRDEGPFSTERAGSVPVLTLVLRAIEEGWTSAEAERRLFREGGIFSYLGTRELTEVLRRIEAGGEQARIVLDAMLYQVRKEVGAMAAVLEGAVDAILLTGGMAHAAAVTEPLARSLEWIAPVFVFPGEDEMISLAEGAARVLSGAEELLVY